MVNIETGRIIDMIYSRESDEVSKWLKSYPNITVVSRDGSMMYAKAISDAHPNAIQVSDRFHLLKGLTDAARQYITRMISTRIRIESSGEVEQGAYWGKKGRSETDLPERFHNATTEKRAAIIQKVRSLAAQGLRIGDIVKETGHSYPTVKKYLGEDFAPEYREYGVSKPSKLKPYTAAIDEMLTKQKTFREIESEIRSLGYAGAASTIRMYATRKRRLNQATYDDGNVNTMIVERKWLLKLLYNPLEKVKGITEAHLNKVIRDYPALAEVYHVVRNFKEVVFTKRVDGLEAWMELAKTLGVDEVNSFINGISRDIDAVKNAVLFDYNNGLAEGSVNKLKLHKRIMYGRCSFDTLRCKTLLVEQRKCIT